MQWYAFHKEAPGGADVPNGMHLYTIFVRSTAFSSFATWE
jgi:hypothetical protein